MSDDKLSRAILRFLGGATVSQREGGLSGRLFGESHSSEIAWRSHRFFAEPVDAAAGPLPLLLLLPEITVACCCLRCSGDSHMPLTELAACTRVAKLLAA